MILETKAKINSQVLTDRLERDYLPATGKCDDLKLGECLTPFQRKVLQKSLQDDLPEKYRQRIQIMLLADEGKTHREICKALGCSQGTVWHWVFMAKSGKAHQWNDNPIGRPKTVNDQYLERLKELVSQNPRELGYAFRRWTAQWLSKHLAKEFGIEVSDRHINRLLKDIGLSTRPKPATIEDSAREINTSARVLIRDLTGTDAPNQRRNFAFGQELWLLNSIL